MDEVKTKYTNFQTGLTSEEVNDRLERGLNNYDSVPKTKSIKEIIFAHSFTFFNFLNISLGAAVFFAGLFSGQLYQGIKNSLFMGVIFVNSIISIVEEIISKKIVDKLSLMNETKVRVIRDSKVVEKNIDEIVLDDVFELLVGHQVICDSVILDGEVEVNEAFITGESEPVIKVVGDTVLSGSFIVSGQAKACVIHVGKDNYVSTISEGAKYVKKANSLVMSSFDRVLKFISIFIIPIGIIMFASQLVVTGFVIPDSVFGTTAAIIGMIPEGLILLTSSVMAVGVIRLSRYKVLVQELHSIETLARVDVICLDKTGTLTEGKMVLKDVIFCDDENVSETKVMLNAFCFNSSSDNFTMAAIKEVYNLESDVIVENKIDFSSSRKFSAISFKEKGVYYLGAPEMIVSDDNVLENVREYQKHYRVLVFARGEKLDENPKGLKVLAILLIEDVIRKEAKETLDYFKNQGVCVKIISGDNLETVLEIASKCGLEGINGVDLSKYSDDEVSKLVNENDVFARVSPSQKKIIVESLQRDGHIVAMTGDGVNDVLALKTSDVGIALASGSEGARNVSELVLLDSNFDSLPKVVLEGRRTINNIGRSASLLLNKTLYTVLLIILSILVKEKYFFVPIQLTLITGVSIGIPSFILALEPNDERISDKFLFKIVSRSVPVSLTVVFNVIMIIVLKNFVSLPSVMYSTLAVYLTISTGFIFLYRICKPFNWYRGLLFVGLLIIFIYASVFQSEFFNIALLDFKGLVIFVLLFMISVVMYHVFDYISIKVLRRVEDKF